jgi:hypothetical protein
MLLAYDYPLLGLLFTIGWFFLWVLLVMILFSAIGGIFRSPDLSGVAKALWLALVLFLPFLGALIFVATRGDDEGTMRFEAHPVNEAAAEGHLHLRG